LYPSIRPGVGLDDSPRCCKSETPVNVLREVTKFGAGWPNSAQVQRAPAV